LPAGAPHQRRDRPLCQPPGPAARASRKTGVQAAAPGHRSYWLRGYRGLLGFAYLTLIPVG
jgi:hypothetical protein